MRNDENDVHERASVEHEEIVRGIGFDRSHPTDLVACAVIEPSRVWRFMIGDGLRRLQSRYRFGLLISANPNTRACS